MVDATVHHQHGDRKTLARVQTAADALKESADALLEKSRELRPEEEDREKACSRK